MGEVVKLVDDDAFRYSGRELLHGCTEVWAIPLFRGNRAHFFIRSRNGYFSKCGMLVEETLWNGQNTLFGAGTYPKCKRCMGHLRRQSVKRGGGNAR